MHFYREDETLLEALRRLDRDGWNAVVFDEFVFISLEQDNVPDGPDWPPVAPCYFFEPPSPKMRAWGRNRHSPWWSMAVIG